MKASHKYPAITSSLLLREKKIESADIHLGTENHTFKEIYELYRSGIYHYIDIRDRFAMDELALVQKIIHYKPLLKEDPASFWKSTNPNSFNLFYFNSTAKKDMILSLLEKKLAQHKDYVSSSMDIVTLADEMMINSLFHAPADSAGKKAFEMTSRDQRIVYKENQRDSQIFLEFYNHSAIIGCIDFYGSLDLADFFNANNVKPKNLKLGMRMGGELLREKSSSLYIATNPGVYTMIACKVPSTATYVDLSKKYKNFHIINVEAVKI